MKKFITNKYILYILGIIAIFLLWWLLSLIINEPIAIFPDPIRTIAYSFIILGKGYFYQSLGFSLLKLLVGFAIAFALAIFFGTIAGNSLSFHKFFAPIMTVLKAIPTVAVVFLFLVLLKANNLPILTVILLVFPILYEATSNGIRNIDNDIIEAMKLDCHSIIRGNLQVKLPLAMPYILVGVASSFALSIKIEIMAEALSGFTGYGLGVAIRYAQENNPGNMVPVFAYSFLAIAIMLIISLGANLIKNALKKRL
ncbi:MAG TPA: ABC transporter permease subunit [Bacilli bacterium]|nr:ABC transporter permease subunit [Bacilli bacterium]HPS19348.1 ABC transporter permease subunit [Bacilli bacterium]